MKREQNNVRYRYIYTYIEGIHVMAEGNREQTEVVDGECLRSRSIQRILSARQTNLRTLTSMAAAGGYYD